MSAQSGINELVTVFSAGDEESGWETVARTQMDCLRKSSPCRPFQVNTQYY